MKSRKVWKFLSLLSANEQERWLAYLTFQYGNRQEYQLKLAEFLVQAFPSAPEDQGAWEHLYPKDPYNDGRLRKLSTDLTTQLEQFLSFSSQQTSPLDQRIHLLRGMIARADAVLFEQTWKKACKDVYKHAESAAELAQYRYELEVLNREYQLHNRMSNSIYWDSEVEKVLLKQSPSQRITFLMTAWDLYKSLDLIIKIENESITTAVRPEIPLESFYYKFLDQQKRFKKLPLVSMYLKIIDLLHGKEVNIHALLSYLYQYHQSIPPQELSLLYGSLLNDFIKKINRPGAIDQHRQLLDLYVWGIEKGLLMHEGELLPAHFKNYVKLCIRSQELDRTADFIQKYAELLPQNTQKELPQLCRIYLAFARKEFEKSIRLINQGQFSSTRDELDVRTILLQSHYELHYWEDEWLENQLTRLVRFTRSQKDLPPYLKDSFVTQFNLLKRLFRAQSKREIAALKLKLQDESNSGIGLRKWLEEKVLEKEASI